MSADGGNLCRVSRRSALAGIVTLAAHPRMVLAQAGEHLQVTRRIANELAPSGRLRAAINLGNTVLAQSGGPLGVRGPSVDIAAELARRLGVPLELIVYPAAGEVMSRLDADTWDVAFLARDPVRASAVSFTPPYVFIEGTYLVRASRYQTCADLDRNGVRIAVGAGAAYDLFLTRTLKQAELVRVPTSAMAITEFAAGTVDAAAGIRQALDQARSSIGLSRVLWDRFSRIEQAIAVPRNKVRGIAYISSLLALLGRSGFLAQSFERAGQTVSLGV